MEIKKMKLDLGSILWRWFCWDRPDHPKRLNKEKHKGIVLLHGLPEQGKTTYLRYPVGMYWWKKILCISGAAANIMIRIHWVAYRQPKFGTCNWRWWEYPDGQEDHRMLRYQTCWIFPTAIGWSFWMYSWSALLTTHLHWSTSAFVAKGKIDSEVWVREAKYWKSQRLSEVLGYRASINRPMTIAEIKTGRKGHTARQNRSNRFQKSRNPDELSC